MKKFLMLLTATLLLGCEILEDRTDVLVQVGTSRLTLHSVREKIPSWDSLTAEQQANYLKSWVDEELLYQAALQKNIDKEKDVAEAIQQAGRKIVIERLVSDLTDTMQVREKEIRDFYLEHPEQFLNGVHRYSVAIISYPSWKLGDSYFRGKKNVTFDKLPVADYRVKKIENFEMVTESPDSCLVPDLRDLKEGVLTGFKVCNGALKSILVYDHQDSADVRPFEEVEENVIALLYLKKKKELMETFRSEQKKKIAVFSDWKSSNSP